MVVMLCIWRSGIGVSVPKCVFAGMGLHTYTAQARQYRQQ